MVSVENEGEMHGNNNEEIDLHAPFCQSPELCDGEQKMSEL